MNPFHELIVEVTGTIAHELKAKGIEPNADAIALLISAALLPDIRKIAGWQIEVLAAIESAAVPG